MGNLKPNKSEAVWDYSCTAFLWVGEFATEGFLLFDTHHTKKNPTSLSQWGFSVDTEIVKHIQLTNC